MIISANEKSEHYNDCVHFIENVFINEKPMKDVVLINTELQLVECYWKQNGEYVKYYDELKTVVEVGVLRIEWKYNWAKSRFNETAV